MICFLSEGKYYQHTSGIPERSALSPVVADILIKAIEMVALMCRLYANLRFDSAILMILLLFRPMK